MQRIIMSLALISIVTGALVYGGTTAFFSDTETSTGNIFTAGAIDLKVDNESYYNGLVSAATTWVEPADLTVEKFFNFLDLKPDDYGEDTISLHVDTNEAYLCANVTLTSNEENGINEPESEVDDTDGPGEGELANLVNFLWWADDGDNVLEDDEEVISQGNFGELGVGNSYPLALADSDENIWDEDGVGPVSPEETYYIGKAWCFGTIEANELEQDGANNLISPAGDNNGNGTAGEPEDGGFTCDGTLLGNESQTDTLTADVTFTAVQARHNDDFQCEEPEEIVLCETPELAYADSVVDYNQGERRNGTAILPDRTDPLDVLDAPQHPAGAAFDNPVVAGSFFSLGFDEGEGDGTPNEGGWIIVEFEDNIIVDGPGNDLKMWEVTGGTSYPVERLKIEVSQTGLPGDWHQVAASVDRDAEADLASSGLPWAKYVRLTDVSVPGEFPVPQYNEADGYDLDAFSALNCGVRQLQRDV